MKKSTYFFLVLFALQFIVNDTKALNYTISFTGSGASTTVQNVVVQNLTKGTSAIVPAGSVLTLTDVSVSVNTVSDDRREFQICPKPEEGVFDLSFLATQSGVTSVSAYSIDGRKVAGAVNNLPIGECKYKLTLPKGLFIIRVSGKGYTYSEKVLCQTGSHGMSGFELIQSENAITDVMKSKVGSSVSMFYTNGDRLLYKGISGNYSTLVSDVPSASKSINFDFVECRDADGNYYSVVKIGTQTWMAENLKAAKYRNGDNVINFTNASDWGLYTIGSWCNYNNDAANGSIYGKLYNWYAASDSRNIAPTGWHVATTADWNLMQNYLIANGYNYDKSTTGNKITKSLSISSLWTTYSTNGTPGCNLTLNNASGLSLVPGGYRGTDGNFYNINNSALVWTSSSSSSTIGYSQGYGYGASALDTYTHNKNYGFSVRCVKDADLPTLTTVAPSAISYTTALSGGDISNDGGATITVRGVCWSLNHNPTIADAKSTDGTGTGSFSSQITGLNVNATYYVRAYATNSTGTAYGEELVVNTKPFESAVTDIDGNVYHSVIIGTQTWMAEDLRTTKYRNGDLIGTTPSVNTNITYETSPKYQWVFNGLESNAPVYGRLYTWYVVNDSRNIAPSGWHVATEAEWAILQNYLIANGYNYDKTTVGNKIAKSLCSTTLFTSTSTVVGSPACDFSKNNTSGFSMLPAGYRGYDGNYYINGQGNNTWTSTESSSTNAYGRGCGHNSVGLGQNILNKSYGFSVRCIKNSVPTISTATASSIISTSATCGGTISADGGDAVTERGVCWSTMQNPTISDSKLSASTFANSFSTSITGLTPNTTYYVRAYATNSLGTSYGDQITIKTLLTDPVTVTDIDGNVYNTITIGNQTWMVENLKTTKLNDGTIIPEVADGQWGSSTTPGFGYVFNYTSTKNQYGLFYNYYAVASGKLAPAGWHVATESDWMNLAINLGGFSVVGGKLKETGTTNWSSPNLGATNEVGFTAVPGGYRSPVNGTSVIVTQAALWWAATVSNGKAGRAGVSYDSSTLGYGYETFNFGFHVRCVKD